MLVKLLINTSIYSKQKRDRYRTTAHIIRSQIRRLEERIKWIQGEKKNDRVKTININGHYI